MLSVQGDDTGGDGGVSEQGGFNLSGFHADPCELHLPVGATEIREGVSVDEPRQVAGSVQPLAFAERVRDELALRLLGVSVIAARKAVTGDAQLPWHAFGHRLQRLVQHVELYVVGRSAYRHARACIRSGRVAVDRTADHGFRRPVLVVDLDVPFELRVNRGGQVCREILAPDHHPTDAGGREINLTQQHEM